MKIFSKVSIILLIIFISFYIFPYTSNASLLSNAIELGDNLLKPNQDGVYDILDYVAMYFLSNDIYNTLFTIGVAVAVIVAMYLGIKFMTGGIEGQVKVKESLTPFIIGCVVVFGSFAIWKIVVLIGNRLN